MVNSKIANALALIFFTSLGLGAFHIYIGFAFKPYMAAIVLIAIYLVYSASRKQVKIVNLFAHEHFYILFLLVIGFSFIHSVYPMDTLRFTLNAVLLGSSYFVLRTFFTNYIPFDRLATIVRKSGFTIAISSIAYYLIGLVALNFSFTGNNIESYGVLIDRGVPRLTGIVSDDPNIAAMVLTFFLLFTVGSKGGLFIKILLTAAILLTFSRGGYLALGAGLAITGVAHLSKIASFAAVKRVVTVLGVALASLATIQFILNIDVVGIASSRFQASASDNGSGRVEIWANALTTFQDYPLFGIGSNSSLSYNIDHYNDAHYVHNGYLEVLSELGIFGVLVYLSGIAITLAHCLYCARKASIVPLSIYASLLISLLFLSVTTHEIYMVTILILTLFMYSYSYRARSALQRA